MEYSNFKHSDSSSDSSKSSDDSSSSSDDHKKKAKKKKDKKKDKKKKKAKAEKKTAKKVDYQRIIEEERLSKNLRVENFAILMYLIDLEDSEVKQAF